MQQRPASEQDCLKVMHTRLWAMCRRYAYPGAPAEDLFQEACIGVILAYREYEAAKGNFDAYAYARAKGRILHYLRDRSYLIRPPAGAWERGEIPGSLTFEIDAIEPDLQDWLPTFFRPRDWTLMLIHALSPEPPQPTPKRTRSPMGLKQLRILRMMTTEGLSSTEAAQRLGIEKRTVDHHLGIIYYQWGVTSLVQAYNEAMRRGLIDPPQCVTDQEAAKVKDANERGE